MIPLRMFLAVSFILACHTLTLSAARPPKSPPAPTTAKAVQPQPGDYRAGLSASAPDAKVRESLKLPDGPGLVVDAIAPGSPAAKAGLQKGDFLRKAGDKPLSAVQDLKDAIQQSGGKEIVLTVNRGDKELKLNLTPAAIGQQGDYFAGLSASSPAADVRKSLHLPDGPGLVVDRVTPGSPADKAGLQDADFLLKAGDKPLATTRDLAEAIDQSQGKEVTLTVNRDGKELKLNLTPLRRDAMNKNPAMLEPPPIPANARLDLYGDPLPLGTTQRLGTVRYRNDAVTIAYSPDGKILAAGGHDNVIRLLDVATGKVLRQIKAHDTVESSMGYMFAGGIPALAFSPDGKVLASGGWDSAIRLWDLTTCKLQSKIPAHNDMVSRVIFSPDGKVLASRGGTDRTAKLWDVATGKNLHTFTGLSPMREGRRFWDTSLAISPDGKTLVTTAPGSILFYDTATGGETMRLAAYPYMACGVSVAFSPDGKLLASAGEDADDKESIRIWEVATGKELKRYDLNDADPYHLAWDPTNNGHLAVAGGWGTGVYEAMTGKPVVKLAQPMPTRLIFSPDGKTLATSGDRAVRLWDAATGKQLHTEFDGHQSHVNDVVASADGKWLVSAGENIRLWDRATGKTVRKFGGHTPCLALSPDGKILASQGGRLGVCLWDMETGKVLGELGPHGNAVYGLAFSADGKLLASGDEPSAIRIWDVNDRKKVQEVVNKSVSNKLSFAFTADNKTVFCAGAWNDSGIPSMPKGTVIRANGKIVGKLEADNAFSFNINSGPSFKMRFGTYIVQWEVETGKEVNKLAVTTKSSGISSSLTLSPDGKLLAASSNDGHVTIWDAQTGQDRLHISVPCRAGLLSPQLAFSPDGKTLASASTDGAIRFWDITTAKETGRFYTPDAAALTSIVFADQGKTLVTGCDDGNVLVWDVAAAAKVPQDRNAPPGVMMPVK